MSRHIQYSIVVPVYNEELVIQTTYQRLKEVMDQTKEHLSTAQSYQGLIQEGPANRRQ